MQLERNRLLPTVVALALIVSSSSAQISAADKSTANAANETPLHPRLVTIGASVSAGFSNKLPLAKVLDEAIQGVHDKVRPPAGGSMFFMRPEQLGKSQVDRTLRSDPPTLVVAVDFLFWYGYGYFRGTDAERLEQRIARLELGFEQLERYKCPIIVGDIPDMHDADPNMLPPHMIPTVKEIAALNKRLRVWVESKPNVTLVPLAKWVVDMKAGKWSIPASADKKHPKIALPQSKAMMPDRLHPSKVGVIMLVDQLVQIIKKQHGKRADAIELDVWKMLEHFELVEEALREPKEDGAPTSRPAGRRR